MSMYCDQASVRENTKVKKAYPETTELLFTCREKKKKTNNFDVRMGMWTHHFSIIFHALGKTAGNGGQEGVLEHKDVDGS